MKKVLVAFGMLLMTASVSNAGGLITKHASSVQLTVDSARSTATRIAHGMSISGSGVSTTDGTTSGVVGNSVLMTSDGFTGAASVVTASQATSGDAFTFTASYTAGTAGSLAGTVDSSHATTLTAGGAGTTATGQFVSEITVID